MANPKFSDELNNHITEETKLAEILLHNPIDTFVKGELKKVRTMIHNLKMKEDPEYKASIEQKKQERTQPKIQENTTTQ